MVSAIPSELETYIARLRKQGMSDEAIRYRLTLAGFPHEEVLAALAPTKVVAATPAPIPVPVKPAPLYTPAPVKVAPPVIVATPVAVRHRRKIQWRRPAIALASVAVLVGVIGTGVLVLKDRPNIVYSISLPSAQAASTTLTYGAWPALSDPQFYSDVKNKFSDADASFITADLSAMTLTVYKNGAKALEVPILAKGKVGSWWETPVGIYEIQSQEENHFSSFGQVNQPWSLAFQGNFFIHGWPTYPDGTEVSSTYSGGCIRLSTADAKKVYELVGVGMPVVVYKTAQQADDFAYQPKGPVLSATSSLAVDIKNGSVLASYNDNAVVPIASITKLMTALVVTEYLNLDKAIPVPLGAKVETTVPRLSTDKSYTVHDLLLLMLTESSNEAAEVLASAVGRQYFVTLMNQKAKAIGLYDTKFDDPSGLSEGNMSSSRDLFLLLQYLYENRRFILDITSNTLEKDAYGSPVFRGLANFNIIAGVKDNFVGGKIGNTDEAKETYAGIYMLNVDGQERPIGVITLGSSRVREDVKSLLNYVDTLYTSGRR
ncbi:L,D-transpeptidase family protein [Acetobacteraceae bacterium]|nr:L,D-transpeptidase family protein [Candidatus Parcubacteria bacterium]